VTAAPVFPPLLTGCAAPEGANPVELACAMARAGCDGGTIVHSVQADMLRAAVVFAPEVPLERAVAMLPVCGVGLQNALGALAPPEVAVQFGWDGALYVNGGRCGGLSLLASGVDPTVVPDWLVVGLALPLLMTGRPGDHPEATALYEESCADVGASDLLEAWARHMLVWIETWESEGTRPVHAEWTGMIVGLGDAASVAGETGRAIGLDEDFGLLLETETGTRAVPLTRLIGEMQ
jgi:biotin-(acetyl-CoA carboxylase) ligase